MPWRSLAGEDMTSPEARISRKIIQWFNWQPHTFAFKVHGSEFMVAGLPDIIACVYGRYVGIETKRPETRHNVSKRQERVHHQIRWAGGVVAVVTSLAEAQEVWQRAADAPASGD